MSAWVCWGASQAPSPFPHKHQNITSIVAVVMVVIKTDDDDRRQKRICRHGPNCLFSIGTALLLRPQPPTRAPPSGFFPSWRCIAVSATGETECPLIGALAESRPRPCILGRQSCLQTPKDSHPRVASQTSAYLPCWCTGCSAAN